MGIMLSHGKARLRELRQHRRLLAAEAMQRLIDLATDPTVARQMAAKAAERDRKVRELPKRKGRR